MRAGVKTVLKKKKEDEYKVVFTFFEHEYFGSIVEARAILLLENGNYSLTHNKVRAANIEFYKADENMAKAINLLEEIEAEKIMEHFYTGKKELKVNQFLEKYYNEDLHKNVRSYIEEKLEEILPAIRNYPIYKKGEYNNPTELPLKYSEQPASVLFHFRSNEEGMNYFITVKQEDQKVNFYQNESKVLIGNGAWMVTPEYLLHFSQFTDGKKIRPFLNKRYIHVKNDQVPIYLEKFVQPLLENHDIYSTCFSITTNRKRITPLLQLGRDEVNNLSVSLHFNYGDWTFPYHNNKRVNVKLEKQEDEYVFNRIRRSVSVEQETLSQLKEMGLTYGTDHFLTPTEMPVNEAWGLDWINQHYKHLVRLGYEIDKTEKEIDQYYMGPVNLSIVASKAEDWFDLEATVHLNDFEIPFLEFKDHILQGTREYELPNGKIFVLPDEWFQKLSNISMHSEANNKNIRLKNMHFGLLAEIDDYITERNNFEQDWAEDIITGNIPELAIPKNFVGELRDYQKQGFEWVAFLHKQGIGPLLADDMGLGKTIQAICTILHNHANPPSKSMLGSEGMLKELNLFNVDTPEKQELVSLIIAPKSLLYNWVYELEKFSKGLKVLLYTGTSRHQFTENFDDYDVIVSSYGTVRSDVDILEKRLFNTIVLDESQAIKNPGSMSAKRLNKLSSIYKLALTGTPIENTLLDVWSQMNFLNPGLLGSYHYFEKNYIKPIEKKANEKQAKELRNLLDPLILRRTKSQVAKELPPKLEKIHYCEMSESQSEAYKKVLNKYRNEFLLGVTNENKVSSSNKLRILNGLTHLRQLALNPMLKNGSYEGDSGKDDEIIRMLKRAIEGGHKILLFSQFVSYLKVMENHLMQLGINYAYLDGSMDNQARDEQVQYFQNNDKVKVFLLSLRAGNSGLNLTAADFVFLADPWWNPFTMKQAEDRAHRIGQTKKVFSYKFITKDTIEEKILKLQQRKTALAENIIPDENTLLKSLSMDELDDLLTID